MGTGVALIRSHSLKLCPMPISPVLTVISRLQITTVGKWNWECGAMSVSTRVKGHAQDIEQGGKRVAHGASTSLLMESLMRLGYATRGLVYAIIGLLALQVVLGGGGTLADPQGAIAATGKTPLGGIVLYAVLVGLVGYGLWGLIRAVLDPLHKGADIKGIAERVGYAVSGISYMLLAVATYGLIAGGATAARNGAQTAQTQKTAGTLLAQPWGAWVLALVAVIIMVVGLSQIYKGLQRTFDQQFTAYALNSSERKWITRLGQFGTAARGLVFTLVGVFLFLAAYNNDPSRAQGIDGVLTALLRQPAGPWLLGIVALGLIAFGLYSVMSGVWLRFKR
jgi:hypothetical protein